MKKFDLKNLQGSKRTLRSGSYATVLAVVVLAFVILVNLVVHCPASGPSLIFPLRPCLR